MTNNIWLLILLMGVVTYIPRAIPALLIEKIKFGKRVEKFLNLIPYTAMAALIFPAILKTDTARPIIGVAGGITAAILAYRRMPVMVCVLSAIAVDLVLYWCII